MDGKTTCCRLTTIGALTFLAIAVPTVWLLGALDDALFFPVPLSIWILYIFVMNTVILIAIGKYVISSFSYPFSNCCFRGSMRKGYNRRFGLEFSRTVERMTRMIKDMTER